MTNLNCSFCDFNSFSSRLINSSELFYSFLSDPALASGHTLVIPKRHVEPPASLTDEESSAILGEISRIGRLLVSQYDGVDVWQKSRPKVAENQIKRNHLHFHIIPSNQGDERYDQALRWSPDQFAPLTDQSRIDLLGLLNASDG